MSGNALLGNLALGSQSDSTTVSADVYVKLAANNSEMEKLNFKVVRCYAIKNAIIAKSEPTAQR